MWTMLNAVLIAGIAAVLLAVLVAMGTRPPDHIHARMWQQAIDARRIRQQAALRQQVQLQLAHTTQYWTRFQQEVLAELAQAPPLPPAPAGPPDPASEVPPLYLYYGTDRRELPALFARGLGNHLHAQEFLARDIAAARERENWDGSVVVRIHAQRAYQNGVRFDRHEDGFVTPYLHPAFLDFHWALADLAHQGLPPG